MTGTVNMIVQTICKGLSDMTPEEMASHDAEIERGYALTAEREKQAAYEKSGAPERYWRETLQTYRTDAPMQTKALQVAKGFMQSVRCGEFGSLVLVGSAGTGKTHLACSLLRELGGEYHSASELVEELRMAKSYSADTTEAKIISHYAKVRLLVLDEIGRGINATDEKYALYQVLNARYNTRKPTVMISNLTKTDFLQYIGTASADRLVESAEVVEMTGNSYRRELRNRREK